MWFTISSGQCQFCKSVSWMSLIWNFATLEQSVYQHIIVKQSPFLRQEQLAVSHKTRHPHLTSSMTALGAGYFRHMIGRYLPPNQAGVSSIHFKLCRVYRFCCDIWFIPQWHTRDRLSVRTHKFGNLLLPLLFPPVRTTYASKKTSLPPCTPKAKSATWQCCTVRLTDYAPTLHNPNIARLKKNWHSTS